VAPVNDPRPGWQHWAACKSSDPELFFTERGQPTTPAKRICGGCLVREDCLEYAMTIPERFGIWGGLSERERRRLRRQRRKAA